MSDFPQIRPSRPLRFASFSHARCYFAPEACARGLCVPQWLGSEWTQQFSDPAVADANIRRFVVDTLASLAHGPVGDEPKAFWRAAWTAHHKAVSAVEPDRVVSQGRRPSTQGPNGEAPVVTEHKHAAQKWLSVEMSDRLSSSVGCGVCGVESPLEAVLMVWVKALHLAGHIDGWTLLPQQSVVVRSNKTYRVDFRAVAFNEGPGSFVCEETLLNTVVEVDGHQWHERTPQQVAARDARDRDLAAAGFTVLHFSFAELTSDPVRCVRDICGHVDREIGHRFVGRIEGRA